MEDINYVIITIWTMIIENKTESKEITLNS